MGISAQANETAVRKNTARGYVFFIETPMLCLLVQLWSVLFPRRFLEEQIQQNENARGTPLAAGREKCWPNFALILLAEQELGIALLAICCYFWTRFLHRNCFPSSALPNASSSISSVGVAGFGNRFPWITKLALSGVPRETVQRAFYGGSMNQTCRLLPGTLPAPAITGCGPKASYRYAGEREPGGTVTGCAAH